MKKVREVIAYKNYFEDFLLAQPNKVQDKIYKVIEIIETYERVPSNYLNAITGAKGLYNPSLVRESIRVPKKFKTPISAKFDSVESSISELSGT